MSATARPPLKSFTVDELRVEVHEDRAAAGRAAARMIAGAIEAARASRGVARVVFAAAPSQNEFLAQLVSEPIDWSGVVGYHMDEYLGISSDHPASFRRYLLERIFRLAGIEGDRLRLIPAESPASPLKVCLDYEGMLRSEPPDIVCAGIGENGHLAFNDPPVADFLDPVSVKVVRLDEACRQQQVNDGCFRSIEEVPRHAYTLTVPALLGAGTISVVVPGPRKAAAVLETLRGPIGEGCPATALRRHPGAVLYLDPDSAKLVI